MIMIFGTSNQRFPSLAGISLVLDAIIGLLLAVPVIAIQLQLGSKVNAGIVELFSKFSPIFKGKKLLF